MREKLITRLGILGLAVILCLSLASYSIDQEAITQAKPDKPPGQDKKGDDAFQDMPLFIDYFAGELHSSSLPLRDSERGITAFAGRRRTIFLEINKNISNPHLYLTLGNRLTADPEDPDPANDGPEPGDYGNYPDFAPPPDLDLGGNPAGAIIGPEFMAGVGVNIKDMIEDYLPTMARLHFKDAQGRTYYLFWGPGPWAGGKLWTNPDPLSAPHVIVDRLHEITGDGVILSPRHWNALTHAEVGNENPRENKHTAFLWLISKGWIPDYCGAFNVSFSYHAQEE